jgi:tubulin epsilon
LNILQRSAERCDQLHGFLCLFSLGGGTGSGLGSSILGILEENFPLIERYETVNYIACNISLKINVIDVLFCCGLTLQRGGI